MLIILECASFFEGAEDACQNGPQGGGKTLKPHPSHNIHSSALSCAKSCRQVPLHLQLCEAVEVAGSLRTYMLEKQTVEVTGRASSVAYLSQCSWQAFGSDVLSLLEEALSTKHSTYLCVVHHGWAVPLSLTRGYIGILQPRLELSAEEKGLAMALGP